MSFQMLGIATEGIKLTFANTVFHVVLSWGPEICITSYKGAVGSNKPTASSLSIICIFKNYNIITTKSRVFP